ncbi:hypothetical protein FHU38_003843 [Saccharomonospora amisosensis]|uniref:Uncharacterized protein n=1 Tax=Saccharomonospora amisosensis TaxID=1128677 RepID=A0A7X5UTM3_9PSEU|nr:hypothetical protein [Saccharomonospora amisosensis]NIJ13499.1 hypothetical protein [Saccharomonospora amisosensis]
MRRVLLGAGILGALAMAASAAGWWLLAGMAVAAALAESARRVVGEPDSGIASGLRASSRLALLVLFATVFVSYAAPAHRVPAAVGFTVLVTVALAAGVRVSRTWRRWLTGMLLVAAAAFVALCFAIPPASPPGATAFAPGGLLFSAAVLFPLFAGLRGGRLAAGAAVAAAVASAALYQLGPVRLGLSPTAPQEVLAAADAAALRGVFVAVVVLATVPAAMLALDESVEVVAARSRMRGLLALGAVVTLLAAVLSMVGALFLAAAAALLEVIVGVMVAGRVRTFGVATAAVALVLLAGLVFVV